MSNKYTILVDAIIDKKVNLQLQLDKIKNISLTIERIAISPAAITALQASIRAAINAIPYNVNVNANVNAGGNGNIPAPRNVPTPSSAQVAPLIEVTSIREVAREMTRLAILTESVRRHFEGLGYEVGKVSSTKNINGLQSYTAALMHTDGITKQVYTATAALDSVGVHRVQSLKMEEGATNEVANAIQRVAEMRERASKLDPLRKDVQSYTKSANVLEGAANSGDINRIKAATAETKKFEKGLSDVNKTALNLEESMKNALLKIIQWGAATTIIYGSLQQFNNGIQYVKDLNKELTNIQIVTGGSESEINALAKGYESLAQELGATTLEVAKGSLEWVRQGKTAAETSQLLRASIMMSKLGNVDAAQATELLTSTLNGFKLEAEDAILVVDKLVGLDNNYATSVAEISTAMARSSNSAQQAGVKFNELASYITVVSSVTRKSSESIGESFKTIFARMENIKLGKMFEDDKTNINDVEKALSLVNIRIRETDTSFRPMGDVMNDVAAKWSTMNQLEQSAVATSIAGIRQRENFLVLMENYNDVLAAQVIAANSAGTAQDRYAIYLENTEAAANRMKTAWEGMWAKTIDDKVLRNLYNASAAVGLFADAIGGLSPILLLVAGAMTIAFSSSISVNLWMMGMQAKAAVTGFIQLAMSMRATGVAAVGMGRAITMGMGAIAIAIAAAVMVFNAMNDSAEELGTKATSSMEQLNSSISKLSGLAESKKSVDELGKRYISLRENTNKTAKEQLDFIKIQNDLKTILPQVSGEFNNQGEFIISLAENQRTLNALKEEEITIEKEKASINAGEAFKTSLNAYTKTLAEIKALRSMYATPDQSDSKDNMVDAKRNAELQKLNVTLKEYTANLKTAWVNMDGLQKAAGKEYLLNPHHMVGVLESSREMIAMLEEVPAAFEDTAEGMAVSLQDLDAAMSAYDTALKTISGSVQSTLDIIDSYNSSGKNVDIDLLEKLKEAYPDYLEYLTIEGDSIRLNTNALELKNEQLIAEQLALAEAAKSKAEGSGSDAKTVQQLEKQIGLLKSLQKQAREAYELSLMKEYAEAEIESINTLIENTEKRTKEKIKNLEARIKQELEDLADTYKDNQKAIAQEKEDYHDAQDDELKAMAKEEKAAKKVIDEKRKALKKSYDLQKKQTQVQSQESESSHTLELRAIEKEKQARTDAYEKQMKELDAAHDKQMKDLDAEHELAQKGLDDQLDAYKNIISERKKALNKKSDERDYNANVSEKNKEIVDIQNELAEIANDNSESAAARRLQLETELIAKQKELSDIQYDYDTGLQETALDEELARYEQEIDAKSELEADAYKLLKEQATSAYNLQKENIAQSQKDFERDIEKRQELINDTYNLQKNLIDDQQANVEESLEAQQTAMEEALDAQLEAVDESYRLRREAMSDDAEIFDEYIEDKLESLESIYESEREKLEQSLEDQRTALEKMLDEFKTKYQKIVESIEEFLKGNATLIEDTLLAKWREAIGLIAEYSAAASDLGVAGGSIRDYEEYNTGTIDKLDWNKDGAITRRDYRSGTMQNNGNYDYINNKNNSRIPYETWKMLPYHSGGIVGGLPKIPEAETFAKLLKGEYVSNNQQMSNFINRTLPSIANMNNNNGDVSVPMTFNVAGNLDKTVLPELKNMIMTTVNAAISNRGIRRNANAFSL